RCRPDILPSLADTHADAEEVDRRCGRLPYASARASFEEPGPIATDGPRCGARRMRRCMMRGARSGAAEDQRAVGATKAEVILHCDVDLHVACGVGNVVQVALRILVHEVDSR